MRNWKLIALIVCVFQVGFIIGTLTDNNVEAVREVSLSIRASLANVFVDHVNKTNKKLRRLIKNQNKMIENDVADSSMYTKSDTQGLQPIRISDE
jgi:hypothetical protein